jgi:hypothetical protein
MLQPRLLSAALLFIAACSQEPIADNRAIGSAPTDNGQPAAAPAPSAAAATPTSEPTPEASPVANETIGGDGSQIRLLPLEAGDAEEIEGELACSFSADGARAAILIGRADVGKDARAFAAVRNAGVLETLAGTATGGFGAMEKGASFAGKGLTVRITRQARLQTGDESSAHRAVLLAQRADGAERRFQGIWTCGP